MDSDKKDARKMPRNEVFLAFFVAFFVPLLDERERIDHPWGFNQLGPSPTTSPGFSCWDIKQFNGPRLSAFCTNQRLSSIFLASPRQQSLKKNICDKFHGVDQNPKWLTISRGNMIF